jgi:hypothetical protein
MTVRDLRLRSASDEFMGEVVEVGLDNKKLKVGDRVVVRSPSAAANASSAGKETGRSATQQPDPRQRREGPSAIRRPDCSAIGL